MQYDLVIFDLDGTLLDTIDDLRAAVNHALSVYGFPPRDRQTVRKLIGSGVSNTIRRALPEGTDDETFQRVLAAFKNYYFCHLNVHTQPFKGIMPMLDAFKSRGILLAVNSNKVDSAVRVLCESHFGRRMDRILGETSSIPRKPAADGVFMILDALHIAPEHALYVGDGETDMMTAQNAGIDCAWVSWGYRTPDELRGFGIPLRFDTAEELRAFVLR